MFTEEGREAVTNLRARRMKLRAGGRAGQRQGERY